MTPGRALGMLRSRAAWNSAFLSGLLRPNLIAFVTAMLVILVVTGLACAIITPALIAGPAANYFAKNGSDDFIFVTSRLLQLERSIGDPPLVALLGGSATREMFYDEEAVAAAFQAAGGMAVEAASLLSYTQSTQQQMLLVEQLPTDRPVLLVIGIGPAKLAPPFNDLQSLVVDPLLGVRSRLFDDEVRRQGIQPAPRPGVYLLDNLPFYVKRVGYLLRNGLWAGPRPKQVGPRFTHDPRSPAEIEAQNREVQDRFRDYEVHAAEQIGALERLVGFVQAHPRWNLVFVEEPINPGFVASYIGAATYQSFRSKMKAFAARHGVKFIERPISVPMTSDDFADWTHLRNERIGPLLRDEYVRKLGQIWQAHSSAPLQGDSVTGSN